MSRFEPETSRMQARCDRFDRDVQSFEVLTIQDMAVFICVFSAKAQVVPLMCTLNHYLPLDVRSWAIATSLNKLFMVR